MNDPKRLHEEMDSELARLLLRAGTRSPWPNSRRNRVLAALGVGLALTSTKQTAFAALATWQKVVLVGCVACAGAAGGVVAVRQTTSEAPLSQLSTSAVAQRGDATDGLAPRSDDPELRTVGPGAAEAKRADESKRAEVTVAADDEQADDEPAPARAVSEPRKRLVASSPPPSQVRQELAMLEKARQSMRQGEGRQALSDLREYSRRFPKGTLRFEAEVLRIEALAAQGRKAEASKRARRILERNPRSVVAARLERYVTD